MLSLSLVSLPHHTIFTLGTHTMSSSTPSLLHPSSRAATSGLATARQRNKASSHPRQSSGVYNTFSAKQIHGFREAFSMCDTNSDGAIDRADLRILLANLGAGADEKQLDRYMESALCEGAKGAEKVNFTQFLTMFGEHLAEVSALCEGYARWREERGGG